MKKLMALVVCFVALSLAIGFQAGNAYSHENSGRGSENSGHGNARDINSGEALGWEQDFDELWERERDFDQLGGIEINFADLELQRVSISMRAPIIRIYRTATITFNVLDADSGIGIPGLSPAIRFQRYGDESAGQVSLEEGDIADGGAGAYTWTAYFTDAGYYALLISVEVDGIMRYRAFPLEVSRAGGEDIFMPSADDPSYNYQVLWTTNPSVPLAGDEVAFDIEIKRSIGPVNTERPWTNIFDPLLLSNLRAARVLVESADGTVSEDISTSAEYRGMGIYRVRRIFPADELAPGEVKNYMLHVIIADDAGFTIDETGEDYLFPVFRPLDSTGPGGAGSGGTGAGGSGSGGTGTGGAGGSGGTGDTGGTGGTTSVSFAASILPIFTQNCAFCHGASNASGGLGLTSYGSIMAGSDNGPVVAPGNSAASRIIRALRGTLNGVPRMPLGGNPLSNALISQIEAWINQGATNN